MRATLRERGKNVTLFGRKRVATALLRLDKLSGCDGYSRESNASG